MLLLIEEGERRNGHRRGATEDEMGKGKGFYKPEKEWKN